MSPHALEAHDRAQIQELRHKYGRALDERDWDLFGSLLADEVDADFSAFGVPAGRVPKATLVAIMQHSFRRDEMKSHQLYANFEIALDGDTATALASLVGRHVLPGFPGGDTFTLHARYHDRLVRTADGWRLAATRVEVLFLEGNVGIVS
jgi:hypothetical protein